MKCRFNKEKSCEILNGQLGDCEIECDGKIVWRCCDYIDEDDEK